jgi:hypothetical protein
MVTWPICVLGLGLALIVAAWDVCRRYAQARGMAAWVEERCAKSEALTASKLADHVEHIDTIKRGTDAGFQQLTHEVQSIKQAMNVRFIGAS